MNHIKKIKQWATDRKLDTADPQKQMWKLVEETGELAAGVSRDKPELIEDAIGDMIVVQAVLLMQVGKDINDSLYELKEMATDGVLYRSDDECMPDILKSTHKLFSEIESHKMRLRFYGTDAVTDILLALENIALNHNLTLDQCIGSAYEEIKDRKGEMRNGVFVKAADL